ncbi:mannonate dehydratase [Salsuginibacillus kocurii]|uniref:mannonate dehydratase n=1 Tax=Salsuginibacillus kocurii TaxID=427078 RepID=UPI0003786A0C|nr:mannonate dehydratase [Salsuginibacillus kocurii]
MMNISITTNRFELTEQDFKQMSQIGIDYVDFGNGQSFPGVNEEGFPDLDEVLKMKRKLQSWGLDINRVTLPNISEKFMEGDTEAFQEVENSVKAIKVFSEAKIPIVRQRFAKDTFPHLTTNYKARQRGGAEARGESLGFTKTAQPTPTLEESAYWWDRFCEAYKYLVPAATEHQVKLAMHPSDTPNHDTPFGGLGYRRIIDAFPNKNVGYVYCVGTRAEEGGSSLVLDEINQYGRKGRIFLVHFRNVRGSLPTAGAFEEALLDEGDMNMFKILWELYKVGYDGCLNPDHIPHLDGENIEQNKAWEYSNIGWSTSSMGWGYSIGYIKALLAALTEFVGKR